MGLEGTGGGWRGQNGAGGGWTGLEGLEGAARGWTALPRLKTSHCCPPFLWESPWSGTSTERAVMTEWTGAHTHGDTDPRSRLPHTQTHRRHTHVHTHTPPRRCTRLHMPPGPTAQPVWAQPRLTRGYFPRFLSRAEGRTPRLESVSDGDGGWGGSTFGSLWPGPSRPPTRRWRPAPPVPPAPETKAPGSMAGSRGRPSRPC